jgi:hypothetical protein|uniref:Uncharacterized protein n=1 Tax=uncultured Caudovirales phage TaxID=2100421 RepID=A0A6J5KV88_9CAUD|nr:hypothetical protein UFOVP88_47 [uncultured Caudovirales phage]
MQVAFHPSAKAMGFHASKDKLKSLSGVSEELLGKAEEKLVSKKKYAMD